MIGHLARGFFGQLKPEEEAPDQPDMEISGETSTMDEQDVGWVAVITVWESADAVVIVARLQDESIPALARPEAVSTAIPVTAGAISAIEILVPEAMADRAIEVLWNLGLLTDQDEADEYEDDYEEWQDDFDA